jgi:hypothetical protein
VAYDLGALVVKQALAIAAEFQHEYCSIFWLTSTVVSSVFLWATDHSNSGASDLFRMSTAEHGYTGHDIKALDVPVSQVGHSLTASPHTTGYRKPCTYNNADERGIHQFKDCLARPDHPFVRGAGPGGNDTPCKEIPSS